MCPGSSGFLCHSDFSVLDDGYEVRDPGRWAHVVCDALHDALLQLLFYLDAYGVS